MPGSGLDERLDGIMAATRFSGVVDVRRDGESICAKTAAYADRANGIPNTLDTRFAVASGSKFFTALAIGRLIDAGELALETRIASCMSWDFPRYSRDITIRQLLTHTSGLPDYYDEESISDVESYRLPVPAHDLRGPRDYLPLLPDRPMKFAPGSRFSYSNSGYILLGVVIEELGGTPFQEFVAREIFEPAGMTRSGYFAQDRLPAATALGYLEAPDGAWRTNADILPIIGASDGGAYTTSEDIHRLWTAFWSGEILPTDLTTEYATPCVEARTEGPNRFHGLGLWMEIDAERGRTDYIVGCDAGVSFWSGVRRDRGLEASVLSNTTHGAWPLVRCIDAEPDA